ncbi:hypothetical protein [Actinomadura xylanilytica]|uniref:hypothetical protein n=1 Tax=Actinomadura xylanilytica TaxID=887459 RepID=UPI00255A9471|nr:hypothetical protein [Actinomadura xylanilytica]MDL4777802.1 hypothetical protein [Actinomadura xylanilytica]
MAFADPTRSATARTPSGRAPVDRPSAAASSSPFRARAAEGRTDSRARRADSIRRTIPPGSSPMAVSGSRVSVRRPWTSTVATPGPVPRRAAATGPEGPSGPSGASLNARMPSR